MKLIEVGKNVVNAAIGVKPCFREAYDIKFQFQCFEIGNQSVAILWKGSYVNMNEFEVWSMT